MTEDLVSRPSREARIVVGIRQADRDASDDGGHTRHDRPSQVPRTHGLRSLGQQGSTTLGCSQRPDQHGHERRSREQVEHQKKAFDLVWRYVQHGRHDHVEQNPTDELLRLEVRRLGEDVWQSVEAREDGGQDHGDAQPSRPALHGEPHQAKNDPLHDLKERAVGSPHVPRDDGEADVPCCSDVAVEYGNQ